MPLTSHGAPIGWPPSDKSTILITPPYCGVTSAFATETVSKRIAVTTEIRLAHQRIDTFSFSIMNPPFPFRLRLIIYPTGHLSPHLFRQPDPLFKEPFLERLGVHLAGLHTFLKGSRRRSPSRLTHGNTERNQVH